MRSDQELIDLLKANLPHLHSGKVRESFALGVHDGEKLRLVYVSDRLSALDFVLGFSVPGKGIVLNIKNLMARECLSTDIYQDLVASGAGIDAYLEDYPELQGIPELQARCLVVKDLEMIPREFIVRGALTGSGFKAYEETGSVSGHLLMPGLRNGQLLGVPLSTPSTKGEDGEHDVLVDAFETEQLYPGITEFVIGVYRSVHELHFDYGLFLADTKLEVGRIWKKGKPYFVLADEVGTPDSSRFWTWTEYLKVWPERLPKSWDKDPARQWLRRAAHNADFDIDSLDPKNKEHVAMVKKLIPPEHVITQIAEGYLHSVLALGSTAESFWADREVDLFSK